MDGVSEGIEYEFSLKPDPLQEQYVLLFEGSARAWDEAAAEDKVVGEIRGHRIDLAAAAHDGIDQGELLESVSSELSDFSEQVMQEEVCFLPGAGGADIEQEECEGIVYISELKVDPASRGHGIGTALLKRMASIVDVNNCLIALKAFPLNEAGEPTRDPAMIDQVKHFYERLGFDRVEGEFMIKDARLCEAMKKKLARRQQQRREG